MVTQQQLRCRRAYASQKVARIEIVFTLQQLGCSVKQDRERHQLFLGAKPLTEYAEPQAAYGHRAAARDAWR